MKTSRLFTGLAIAIGIAVVFPPCYGSDSDDKRTATGFNPIEVLAGEDSMELRVPPPPGVNDHGTRFNRVIINFLPVGASNSWGDTSVGWPDDAKAAFTHAANIWASLLKSTVPIKISACYGIIPKPGVLGRSGSMSSHRDFAHAPMTGTWYSASLANALAGVDLNNIDGIDSDGDGNDADVEFQLTLSSAYAWYTGLDGNCPAGSYDLVTVCMHEICHGLNFAGSMRPNGATKARWGTDGYPNIYDRFAENRAGQSLINTNIFANNSVALLTQLTSTNIYFDGPNAKAANGGVRPHLYCPPVWNGGSSYSHFDSDTYVGTSNSMMIHFVNRGVSIHNPGGMTMGLLADVGWPTFTPPPVERYIFNDFNGDRISDLVVFSPERAYWFVYSLPNSNAPVFAMPCGPASTNTILVPGDFDGDRFGDCGAFRNGIWYSTAADQTIIFSNMWWGWNGATPLWGDYDGDQTSDLAIYDSLYTYCWYIVSQSKGQVITWGLSWGVPGAKPVPGDYDGDGIFDLAIYNPANGYWYIKTLTGNVLLWGLCWGSEGAIPVPGDFNGDGLYDLAVYTPADGWWFIALKTPNGVNQDAPQFYQHGGPDFVPVSGDFNGDRISDLATFDKKVNGMWYIKTTSGEILTWTLPWGWPNATISGEAK